MKCFYHNADLDGQCSGAIVKRKYPDCEMIGINYGDLIPWETIAPDEDVWMVDFSLQPFSDMVRLNGLCRLTWIDHHKTSIDEHNKIGFIANGDQRLSLEDAGCELTWMKIENDWDRSRIPIGVRWLGRYDIWRHADYPGSLEFQFGMRFQEDTRPENQSFWDQIFTDARRVAEIRDIGQICLRYEDLQNAKYCRNCAFEINFAGLCCIAVNKGLTGSLTFKSVYDRTKHDAMLSFYLKNGKWTVSLYSDKTEVDVSTICKAYGGGGHKGAAGFQCARLPWTEES